MEKIDFFIHLLQRVCPDDTDDTMAPLQVEDGTEQGKDYSPWVNIPHSLTPASWILSYARD
jgi:hypothetical protein